jgi:hypothetical protein
MQKRPASNHHQNPIRLRCARRSKQCSPPEDVIELRAFHKGKKRVDAGYFDGEHREDLVNAAATLNASSAAVYVTLNRIDPQLLGRCCNRVEPFASATVTDANVIHRRWLMLDFDPVRPKDTSATKPHSIRRQTTMLARIVQLLLKVCLTVTF